jgi:hypothetical protein
VARGQGDRDSRSVRVFDERICLAAALPEVCRADILHEGRVAFGVALRKSRPGRRWTRVPGRSCDGRAMTGTGVIGIRVPTAVGLHQLYSWECRDDHRPSRPPPTTPHAPSMPASGEHDGTQHDQLEWHGHLPAPRTLPIRLDPLVAPRSRFGCASLTGSSPRPAAPPGSRPAAKWSPSTSRTVAPGTRRWSPRPAGVVKSVRTPRL